MESRHQRPPSVPSAAMCTLAKAVAPQGGGGSVSKHASCGTSFSAGIQLKTTLGWLLRRESYRCVCPALCIVMVSGRHTNLGGEAWLWFMATGTASESPGLGLRLEYRVRGAFQR